MKKLITIGFLCLTAGVLNAQDASGRVDTRVLAGMKINVADEFRSLMNPVFVLNSLYYNVTNKSDGLILCRSNATVLVHVGLPNPTNYPGRRFEVTTMGACTATLSNSAAVGTFTDMFTMTNATVYAIASNKTAIVFSTGTNWVARIE